MTPGTTTDEEIGSAQGPVDEAGGEAEQVTHSTPDGQDGSHVLVEAASALPGPTPAAAPLQPPSAVVEPPVGEQAQQQEGLPDSPLPDDPAVEEESLAAVGGPASSAAEQPHETEPAAPGQARRPRRTLVAAALAAVLIAVGVGGLLRWAPWAGLPDDAAFQVGDTVVTDADVQRRTDVLRALYGVQVPEDAPGLDRFRRDTAKAMAISVVLDDLAREKKIAIADKTVSDALDRFLAQRYPQGGRAAYVQALAAQGVGEKDVLAEIRRQLVVRDLFDRTTKDVAVSDAELRKVFDADPAKYAQQQQRQLRHIVVADQTVAQAVLRRLRAGQPFAAVAAQVSLDGSTKGKGGDLGLVTAAELDPAFAKAAFAVAQGSLFGPVQTPLGWHVGKVDRVVPGAASTFEQVRSQLREQQETERAVAVWRDYITARVADADVEYAADYRPADPRPDVGTPGTDGPSPSPSPRR